MGPPIGVLLLAAAPVQAVEPPPVGMEVRVDLGGGGFADRVYDSHHSDGTEWLVAAGASARSEGGLAIRARGVTALGRHTWELGSRQAPTSLVAGSMRVGWHGSYGGIEGGALLLRVTRSERQVRPWIWPDVAAWTGVPRLAYAFGEVLPLPRGHSSPMFLLGVGRGSPRFGAETGVGLDHASVGPGGLVRARAVVWRKLRIRAELHVGGQLSLLWIVGASYVFGPD